jgi:hypothetical protein
LGTGRALGGLRVNRQDAYLRQTDRRYKIKSLAGGEADYSTAQLYCSDTQIVKKYLVPTSAKKGPLFERQTENAAPTGKKQS